MVNGKCPIHPDREVEIIEEENYFFRFSKYQKQLLDLYDKNPDFVIPKHRQKEIYNFVKNGLQDFSISRLKAKMPWGVPVPGDDDHVMYVWFDALINYISCLGWPENKEKFAEFWGTDRKPNAIQIAGKDNLRQQTAMWQAMLLSAGLPVSKQVLIHGFINLEGQKISKSSGAVLPNPIELVDKYGIDAVRYYLLRGIPTFEDGDFSIEKLEELYNSDLANGLGNLVSRVFTLAIKNDLFFKENIVAVSDKNVKERINETKNIYRKNIQEFKLYEVLEEIWKLIKFCDGYIELNKPWQLKNNKVKTKEIISDLLNCVYEIADLLAPFMPQTSETIKELRKKESGTTFDILFPRL